MLSEAEDKLVLGIPLVVRIRPVVVQPETVLIPFQLEDIRIAAAVGDGCMTRHPSHCLSNPQKV